MQLHPYLVENGFSQFEGSIQQVPEQIDKIRDFLVETYRPQSILEIGFNAGHSAEVFLYYSDKTHITSIDIGEHPYVACGKKYLNETYPGRHILILGDSKSVLPNLHTSYPEKTFDMILIDGDHSFEGAFTDLVNCRLFSHADTIVIMDDTKYLLDGNMDGPTCAWNRGLQEGIIIEEGREMFTEERGMSWGKYTMG
jgi:predicted O-methyltransferase YrrM